MIIFLFHPSKNIHLHVLIFILVTNINQEISNRVLQFVINELKAGKGLAEYVDSGVMGKEEEDRQLYTVYMCM